MTLSQLIS